MRLREVAERLGLAVLSGGGQLEREVKGAYASDLMSEVIGNAGEGFVWVTVQTHVNTVAVAVMKDLAAIVFAGGHEPEAATLAKAGQEGVVILASALPVFELAGRLYGMGVRGSGSR